MEGGELTLLEMATALNDMERDMDSWEADFHDSVLKRLRAKQPLTGRQEGKLREIYEKYLGDKSQADGFERSDEEDDPDDELDL